MRTVHPRAWAERSVPESIESFRASFKRMGVPETDCKVTWDTEALWARVRFAVPATEPRRIVEHLIRYDETKHPRKHVNDVPWTFSRGAHAKPLRDAIVPWDWRHAERMFLERLAALGGVRRVG